MGDCGKNCELGTDLACKAPRVLKSDRLILLRTMTQNTSPRKSLTDAQDPNIRMTNWNKTSAKFMGQYAERERFSSLIFRRLSILVTIISKHRGMFFPRQWRSSFVTFCKASEKTVPVRPKSSRRISRESVETLHHLQVVDWVTRTWGHASLVATTVHCASWCTNADVLKALIWPNYQIAPTQVQVLYLPTVMKDHQGSPRLCQQNNTSTMICVKACQTDMRSVVHHFCAAPRGILGACKWRAVGMNCTASHQGCFLQHQLPIIRWASLFSAHLGQVIANESEFHHASCTDKSEQIEIGSKFSKTNHDLCISCVVSERI